MTRQQQYAFDSLVEKNVARFVDENFYSKSKLSADICRWADKQHQFAGIDLTIRTTNVDEKIKYRNCLNSVLQYPSFELEFTNKAGNRQTGWFMNAQLSTDYYALYCVFATTADENQLTADNAVSAVDVLLVKKSDVKDMVQEQMSDQQLKDDMKEIKEDLDAQCYGKARKRYPHGKFWLTYSSNLKEQPINLVTTRDTLEKLPHTRHFYITKDKVNKI